MNTVAVREVDADWIWVVDDSLAPAPDALECLLAAAADLGPLPSPVLLSSKVVMPDGAPDPASALVPRFMDPDLAIAAAERGLVSLRVVRPGSLLVRRHAGAPADDGLAWSARLLKDEPGYLVPASVGVRRTPRRGRDLRERLALLRGDALERAEKPWFAFRLIEDAVSGAGRRAGRAGSPRRSPR